MRILGIDTSGKVAAAALYDSEAGCLLAQQSVYTKRPHSQVILPLAERLLADTGLQWQDVDGFAVAKGPGSYTGLRIGIAAVKAMAYALQIPIIRYVFIRHTEIYRVDFLTGMILILACHAVVCMRYLRVIDFCFFPFDFKR